MSTYYYDYAKRCDACETCSLALTDNSTFLPPGDGIYLLPYVPMQRKPGYFGDFITRIQKHQKHQKYQATSTTPLTTGHNQSCSSWAPLHPGATLSQQSEARLRCNKTIL